MPGKAAKVRLSEKPLDVLQELSRSRTEPKCVVQRASIMVFAFEGRWNQEIATQVELHPQQVGTWRQRCRDSWESLCLWERHEPRQLCEAPVRGHSHEEVLADAPRPGSPGRTTAEQVAQIIALACEEPKLSGRPITRWTLNELRGEALQRKIVPTISRAQIGRYLQRAAVQPQCCQMWLNTTEKDEAKFQREVEAVCQTYL